MSGVTSHTRTELNAGSRGETTSVDRGAAERHHPKGNNLAPRSISALRALVRACNYRDAVVASGHTDKLDLAVERYAHAISKAQELLEAVPDDEVSRG